ncbi:MotA/TolQ/ExbB proton channel family protein [candidate division KSB1 bacterium]|nr:MotA/TolQ/ExbB proton channel family protein [candidate division KSB1 bacterium]
MLQFFKQGGFYMWPLLVFAVVIIVLFIKKIIDLFFNADSLPHNADSGINAILFWGVMSIFVGVFGHFHGIYLAMQAISHAGDISPAIVSQGYAMSLITVLSGLFIFMIAALMWFVLRWRYKKLSMNL